MFKEIIKDVTTVEEGLVVHGVNCSGVAFGSGVAGAIRKTWVSVYHAYLENGGGPELLGTTHFVSDVNGQRITVANAYTQVKYGADGKRYADLAAVEKCVTTSVKYASVNNQDMYMPKIGCGLGGLSWEDEVKPIIEKVAQEFKGVNIFVCDL